MDDQWLQSYRGKSFTGREVRVTQCNFHVAEIFTCSIQGIISSEGTDDTYFDLNTPGASTDEAFSKAKAEVIKQFGEDEQVPEIEKG